MRLYPRTANVALATAPDRPAALARLDPLPALFTRTVLARSANSVNAPSPQASRRRAVILWSALGTTGSAQVHLHATRAGRRERHLYGYVDRPGVAAPDRRADPGAEPGSDSGARGAEARRRVGFRRAVRNEGARRTVSGPLRVSAGKFGNALDFDGVDDWVTVKAPRLASGDDGRGVGLPEPAAVGHRAWRETARGAAWSLDGDEGGIRAKFARGTAPKLKPLGRTSR